MNSLIKVLKTDNELNGVVAIRLIIDIYKSFKTSLPTIVQPVVDIFLQFYANFEKTIEKYLGRKPKRNNLSTGDAIITEPSDQAYDTRDYLIPCIESCKFMIELPIFIIYFFRSSPLKDTTSFTTLFEKVHDIFNYDIAVSDDIMASPIGKERVEDFMLLRVKTISFLVYTSKYVDKKNDNGYVKDIPRFVIKCLKECPDECITPRKEMFLIMRHIVNEIPLAQNELSGICSHFMPYMNDLTNDSVLIGKSRSAYETVRSSAYSTVLEILNFNQNKIDFTPTQMSSCITFCTKLLCDTSLGLGIHALAVGLLVSLSQTIYKNIAAQIQQQQQPSSSENGSTTEPPPPPPPNNNTTTTTNTTNISELVNMPHIIRFKEILLSIIRAFVQKVKYLSKLIKKISNSKKKPISTENANDNSMILPFSPYKFNENFMNDITYCCTMFKHLIFGLKTIVLVFTSVPRDERSKFPELPLLNKLFRYGLDCFDIYNLVSEDTSNVESITKQKIVEEEKDIFNNYSSLYTSLSAPLFTEIFKTQFEYLYKKLLDGRPMTFIHIPANVLSSNPNIASVFSEILLKFLLKRMDKIAKDRKEAQYMHNLFKLVFGSTVTFPKNESVLKNHMTSIVTSCFTYASKFKECMDYYLILRSLFNSILSAKFDLLCKEFAQLLPTVLEKLSDLVNNAHDRETRNLFVELCLTVPSKLHVLCPYLHLLIKPILYALQPGASEKATTAALRNLDLWVTSLRNESLEAILKPVIPDLLKALFTHLKPQHHANGATAMRLLAKLGGTHRQYMSELTSVNTKEHSNSLFFNINFKGNNNMIFTQDDDDESNMLPADDLVDLSIDMCLDRDNDIQTKKSAFDFLKTCILSMISTTEEKLAVPDDFKFTTKHVPIKKYFHISASSPKIDNYYHDEVNVQECKTTMRYEGEIAMFNKVLKSIFLFLSYAVKENLTECIEFTKNLIRHFAITAIFNSYNYEEPSKFRINHDWFYEVLLDVYEEDCTEASPNVNVGDFILGLFTDYVYEICNDEPDLVIQFGIWERLQSRFTKSLYQPEWYKKCVGARGILFLCESITPVWLVHYESDMLKGLFFSLKNPPIHMIPHTNQITIMAAETLIRSCYHTPLLDFTLLFSNNISEKIEYIQAAQVPSTLAEGEYMVHAEKMGKDLVFKKRSLLSLICSELSSPLNHIRKIAQSLLRLSSDLMNIPLSSIIDRFRPDASQSQKDQKDDGSGKKDIGLVTTSLEYSVLQLSTRDNNVPGQYISSQFTKALNLLRNDELYSKDTKDQKKLLAAKLVALKLLREAIVSKELRYNDKDSNKDQLKIMIETICKFLVANNKDVVTIAKTALLTYMSQFKPPKDSLQQALRQLSTNLVKYTQLTLPFVHNAAFFLKVNSNIQIQLSKAASTLLEHLKKWADKQQIKHISNQKEKPVVAAEIVVLFSIIPDTSDHLPALVKLVLLLESVWADEIKSLNPFVAPLAKYLNIYPEQAIRFLFETSGEQFCYALSTKRTLKVIIEVLNSRKATNLRAYLFAHPNVIANLLSSVNHVEFTENQSFASDPNNVLILVGNIFKLNPTLFAAHREIFDQVLRIWTLYLQQLAQNPNAMDLSSDTTTTSKGQYITETQRIRFTKKLLKLMISYCNNNENEVDTLFNMVKVFSCGLVMDLSFVMEFFELQVGGEYNLKRQEAILNKFLEEFKKEGSFQMKSDIIKHIAIPIVRGIAKKEKLNTDLLRRFIDEKVLFSSTFAHFTEKEKYSINTDLLQLLTLFVRFLPSTQLDVLKKEKNIFKFCYDNCCKDDITAAQCAFVLFAHLMSKLDLPPKLIQPVYIAFLKDCKKDSKSLVLPALDMVMQPVKKAELANEPKKFPQWIRSTKQTLLDDMPSTHQLANIWTIFIRHADSFYDSRECFVYKMINALSKIGYSSINLENKKLYIQLADVIISWEERAAKKRLYGEEDDNEKKRKVEQTDLSSDDSGVKKRKVDEETSLSLSPIASSSTHEFTLKPQSRGIVLNFLIRMCIFVSQTRSEKPQALYKECIQILKRSLQLWKDEPVSLTQAEKFFPNSEESAPTIGSFTLSCILELMNLLVEMNRDTIQLNAQFAKRLIPFLTTPYVDVNRNVCIFFKTLFKHFDPLKSNDKDVKEFYETIWNSVKETITKYAAKDLPQPAGNPLIDISQHLVYGSFGHLLLLHVLCEHYRNDEIKQNYSKPVCSMLGKALKNVPPASQESSWREVCLGYIELCLSFLADGVNHEAVFKHYGSSIYQIIEKAETYSYNILHLVMDIVLNWLRTNPSSELQRSYTLQLDDGLQTTTLSKRYKIQDLQKANLLARLGYLSEQSQSSELVKNLGIENFNQFRREYFNVVAELYQQIDEISEISYAKKIESCFMAGLKIESKDLRDIKLRFISILNQRIEKTVQKRLQFVIDHQKWEPLSDRFWIKHALELLLESIEQEEKLTCHPKMAKFPPISTKPVMTSARGESIHVTSTAALEKLRKIFEDHEPFLQSISSIKTCNIITSLKTLIRSNTTMVLKTWGQFFALAWNSLSNDEKPLLQIQMQKLVSIDYHSKQYTKYPNVIQALLLGINNAVLNKKRDLSTFNYLSIHPETLKFLGKSFNAWSLTLPLLEEELRFLFTTGSFDEKTEKVCHSLTELYRVLKEDDILCGIFRCCDITDHTKLVLSLEQRNNWCEAQEALKELINAFHKGNIKKKVSHTELQLWEDHWIICSKKLQQWDELTKFSQSAPGTHGYFNLECLWKNGQWAQMKELFQKNQSLENQLMKFYHISYLIMQDKESDAGDVFAISQQLALQRWCALPSFICGNHTSMLQCFQQLYELNESASLLNDTKRPLTTHELKGFLTTWRDRLPNKYEDITVWNDIFTWRCHLLKKAIERFDQKEEYSHHRALLLNETIWSLHKFAKIARKQNFIEPALKMLAETGKLLPTLTSETSEVFVRIIEVIKSLMKDRRYNDVLDYIESDTIANTKIKTIQKMEILRLRGEVFSTCGRYDESYQTFAQSISYFPQEQKFISSVTSTPAWGKSFFQWALVLDKLFVEKWNSPTRHQRQKQNSTKHPTQSMTALEFAENCVAAYLLAIRYSGGATNHQTIQASGATVRQYIGRVLWLLSYDEPASNDKTKGGSNVDYPLHRVAEKCINDIPAWMWIPWHQQLFTMLHRRECEASIAKQLLKAVLYNFPQAAFHTFRSFVHDLRELLSGISKKCQPTATSTAGSTNPSSSESNPNTAAPLRGSSANIHVSIINKSGTSSGDSNIPAGPNAVYLETFTKIRRKLDDIMHDGNKVLFSDLESMFKELTKYKSESEEELTKSLELMLDKAYTFNIYENADTMVDEDSQEDDLHFIPKELTDYAKRIADTYFADPPAQSTNPQPVPKPQFILDCQSNVITDILPRKERRDMAKSLKYVEKTLDAVGPRNLLELTKNLKHWICYFRRKINLLPTEIGIENQKPKLLEHKTNVELEVPGQYELTSDREPFSERHEKILCLLPSVSMKGRKNKENERVIALRSVSGKVFRFFIQSTSNAEPLTLKTEEKVSSLIRHINRLLDKDRTARSHNNIHIEYPITVTTNQRIRLVRKDYELISLEDIFYDYCESIGKSIDTPLIKYWKEMDKACKTHINEFENKLNVYQTFVEQSDKIPDDILLNYIRSICPSWSEFYSIRKTFGVQSGVYNIFSHLLHTKDRHPYKILISKNSGHLMQFDYRPNMHKSSGIIQRDDPTPFRFTRNISQFLSQFGVEGYLLNTMSAVACSLSENKDLFETLMQLFIRDELISYHNFNVDLLSNESSTPTGENRFLFNDELMRSCVQQNVDHILEMVRELAPAIPTHLSCNPPQTLPVKKKSKKDTATSESATSEVSTPSSITTPSTPSMSSSATTTTATSSMTVTPFANATSLLDLPPLNYKVYELIQQASSAEKLCMKDPIYYPWF